MLFDSVNKSINGMNEPKMILKRDLQHIQEPVINSNIMN